MMTEFLSNALKGFGMGAANVVPGVSGGTIALLTGIYGRIVDAIDSFTAKATWQALLKGRFADFWKCIDGNFLLALGMGMALSIVSLAKVMTLALNYYPIPTWAFFFGLILASAFLMFRDVRNWKWTDAVLLVAGAAAAVAVCTLTPRHTPDAPWFLFFCGAVAICTMILPGISGSFVLLVMGKYEFIMEAIHNFDIKTLCIFGAGCVAGILAFAKFLHWLLARWEKQTMIFLLGFVLGSLVKVWPWSDTTAISIAQLLRSGSIEPMELQIPAAAAFCLLGVGMVMGIQALSNNKK